MAILKRLLALYLLCLPLSILAASAPSYSADEQEKTMEAENGGWDLSITPYLWTVNMIGDATIKGNENHVDIPFYELIKRFNIGGSVHIDINKAPWTLFFDPTYIRLSGDTNIGPIDLDITFEYVLVEFGLMYQFAKIKIDAERKIKFDSFVGGRYTALDAEIDVSGGPDIRGFEHWLSPIIGGRMVADLNQNWRFNLRADIGGFGLGSTFAWNALAFFSYNMWENTAIIFGYRALSDDFRTGSGDERFKFDITSHGMLVGARLRF